MLPVRTPTSPGCLCDPSNWGGWCTYIVSSGPRISWRNADSRSQCSAIGGAGGESKGTEDGIRVGDRARDVFRVVVDVGDLFVAASSTSGFSRDDVACFVTFETQCEFKREKCSLRG